MPKMKEKMWWVELSPPATNHKHIVYSLYEQTEKLIGHFKTGVSEGDSVSRGRGWKMKGKRRCGLDSTKTSVVGI